MDGQLQPASLTLQDGKIVDISLEKAVDLNYDFGALVLMPGAIDAHVHINEPGRTDWEGFHTATRAAAKGGTTTLVDMPLNSSPVTIHRAAFEAKVEAAQGQLHSNCGLWAGAINADTESLRETLDAGCLGVKVFLTHSGIEEFPNISLADLDLIMPLIKSYDVPLLVHCELDDGWRSKTFEDAPTSYSAYLTSRPKSWENKAIEALIALCRKHDTRTHIVHLASAEALGMIEAARAEGLPLSVETCPHYIFFHAEAIPDADTTYKCAPPIREKANNDLLIQAIQSGTIDLLATDHSPAPPDLKAIESGNLQKAWGGIASVQFLLSASWTALKNHLDIEQFIPLITENPATFTGLSDRKGQLKVGYDADITVWNPTEAFVVDVEMVWHRHKVTPYIGQELFGQVEATFVNGILVYHNGQMMRKNAGKIVLSC